jgi:hypothetical protein
MDLFSLGDIVTASGTYIRQDCLMGNYMPHSNRFRLAQLPCIKPTAPIISNWVRLLQHTFDLSHPKSTLPFTLGDWTRQGLQEWMWFISPGTHRIYLRQLDGAFGEYILQLSSLRRSNRLCNQPFRLTTITCTPPPDLKPVSVFSEKDNSIVYLQTAYQNSHFEHRYYHDDPIHQPILSTASPLQSLLPQSLRWVLNDNIIPAD